MAEGKSYNELARDWDEKVERKEEMEGLVRVDMKVKPNADSIYSMRFTHEEITQLRQAAADRGIKLSEFVRAVLMEATRPTQHKYDPVTVYKLRERVRELAEIVHDM